MNLITWNIIDKCLAHFEEDWAPFHDIYRNFDFKDSIFMKPSKEELLVTLELIEILMFGFGVNCLEGPEMKPFAKTNLLVMEKLHKYIQTKPYESYNYGIWFDKK